MATRSYNSLFGGGISSIEDGMNFVRDWKKEQNRLTQYDDEADIREKKRLEAEEALRLWKHQDIASSREATALGVARDTLWTEDAMGRVREAITPEQAARAKIATGQAGLAMQTAMAGATQAGAGAVTEAPNVFSKEASQLDNDRIGLGGEVGLRAAANRFPGFRPTMEKDGRYNLKGLLFTPEQLQRLSTSGRTGLADDEMSKAKDIANYLERLDKITAPSKSQQEAGAKISELSEISNDIGKRLQEDRRMPEDERRALVYRKNLIDSMIDQRIGMQSPARAVEPASSNRSITSPTRIAPIETDTPVAPATPAPLATESTEQFTLDSNVMRIKAIEDSIAELTSQLRVAASRNNKQLQNELTARIARLTGELNRVKQR